MGPGGLGAEAQALRDAMANGVNAAFASLSRVDLATLNRFAASAGSFMRASRGRGYAGPFHILTFDHDQTYRRVRRRCPFRCLVPVVSPGGWIDVGGSDVFVPEGQVVYLEFDRLLFGEGAAVPGYCCPARTVAVVVVRILLLPVDHYVDDFASMFWAEDVTCPGDVYRFLTEVLRFHVHPDKYHHGSKLIHLGTEVPSSDAGLQFLLSAEPPP